MRKVSQKRKLVYKGLCVDGEEVSGYVHTDDTYTLVFSRRGNHLATLFVKSHIGFSKITEAIKHGDTRDCGEFNEYCLM